MTPDEVLAEFRAAGALMEGHFILSSGLRSPVFLQKMRVFEDPPRAERLCRALAETIRREVGEVDLVVSPAIGGIIPGYETARALGDLEAAAQLELALLTFDEHRLAAERPCSLISRDDAADCRRHDQVHLPERAADLVGQRAANALASHRILEDAHLLQEDRRAQAGGKDEVPLQEGAGGAEFGEDFVVGHGGLRTPSGRAN